MGIIDRLTTMIKAKISSFLDRHEDPRETLITPTKAARAAHQCEARDRPTSLPLRSDLNFRKPNLNQNIEDLNNQAREAVTLGRDDLARLALERKKRQYDADRVTHRTDCRSRNETGKAHKHGGAALYQSRSV